MKTLFLLWLLCMSLPGVAEGELLKGIYGVPSISQRDPLSYVAEMEKAGVNGVFVPADRETVAWFKKRGFQVFVSVNAFGGKGGWKRFPDARPVRADGSLLGSEPGDKGHGGVCPTHEGWRAERLKEVARLVREFGGDGGVDGIWLDFIRYPGFWETVTPEIPDTCYCPRCLRKFAGDRKVGAPEGLHGKEAAAWIKENAPYEWMTWKKEQITSFVKAVKEIVAGDSGKRDLKLGVFLVPWTKGERGNAVSYLLGQDPFELGEVVDLISPMVYHRMCGKTSEWVGYMVDYYKETVKCGVWPIVEAGGGVKGGVNSYSLVVNGGGGKEGVSGNSLMVNGAESQITNTRITNNAAKRLTEAEGGEFGKAVKWAWRGGADGVLVYSFRTMGSADYADFADVRQEKGKVNGYSSLVNRNTLDGTTNTPITINETENEWVAPLGDCEAGVEYVFEGEFWRDGWRNGVYPSVRLWGREFLVDTHLKAKVWQPIRVNVVCPDEVSDPSFRLINRNRGTTFRLRSASVRKKYRFQEEPGVAVEREFFKGDFFPIGVYGADLGNLEEIKRLAVNTVILGGSGEKLKEKVEKCHEVGLRYVLSAPHDPDRLPVYLDEIGAYARPYDMAFYVNDEPGIWSFPVNKANDMNRLIKDRFPGCAACMAVVRPQVCGDYGQAADFFMLDQYPVPYMPFVWLSDSMDCCAGALVNGSWLTVNGDEGGGSKGSGEPPLTINDSQLTNNPAPRITNTPITNNNPARGRLAAVIQAFGGERWKDLGWPRLPSEREMGCLAFLSVVNGARGIFFYTYGIMGKTAEGREALGHVVGRLNQIYPWLVVENSAEKIDVEMVSENRFDPQGRPAVQCCVKRKGGEWMVMAVNTIGTAVEAEVGGGGVNGYSALVNSRQITNNESTNNKSVEVFSGEDYVLKNGKIRVRLEAYGVKAFVLNASD